MGGWANGVGVHPMNFIEPSIEVDAHWMTLSPKIELTPQRNDS